MNHSPPILLLLTHSVHVDTVIFTIVYLIQEFEAQDIIMSDGKGNPTELFSVKGMVALVCHQLEFMFFPLITQYAVQPLVTLCNDSEYTRQSASLETSRPLTSIC